MHTDWRYDETERDSRYVASETKGMNIMDRQTHK